MFLLFFFDFLFVFVLLFLTEFVVALLRIIQYYAMARLISGINGPFIGTVGTVVGSSWYGIPYMKSRYKRRTTKVSKKEKDNRGKFAMAHFWLQPLLVFVREGFKNYSLKSRGFNAAKSYLLKNAFEGQQPDLFINPALVKVSAGDLPLSSNITAEKAGDTEIKFTWDTKTNDTNPFDQVMMLAYNVESRKARYITTGQLRHTGVDTLAVYPGQTYHLYLAFNAADRSRQSDSVYLGEMSM